MKTFLISCFLVSAFAATPVFQQSMQAAKQFMAQGKRKEAMQELTKATTLAKKKAELREVGLKRGLFSELFLTSEAFQKYQEANAFCETERWDDCLRALAAIDPKDADNALILRLSAQAKVATKQFDQAEKILEVLLSYLPDDFNAVSSFVEVLVEKRNYPLGLETLKRIEPKSSSETEKVVILKAKILATSGQYDQAVALLKQDQEAFLDHVEVVYELGLLYAKKETNLWPARKMFSLFISRCKRMTPDELKKQGFEMKLEKAQVELDAIDKKLGV